jgi:hypothetical protein
MPTVFIPIPRPMMQGATTSIPLRPRDLTLADPNLRRDALAICEPALHARSSDTNLVASASPIQPPARSSDPNLVASASPIQPPARDADPNLGAPASKSMPPAPPTITTLLTSDCNLLEQAKEVPRSDKNNGIKKRGTQSAVNDAPTVAPKRQKRQPMQDITERNIIRSQANKRLIKPSGKLRDGS